MMHYFYQMLDRFNRYHLFSTYLQMAEEIICKTGIRKGRCLHLNAGNGLLGLALAQISEMDLYLVAESLDLQRLALANVKTRGLESRITVSRGDIDHLSLIEEHSVNLVISRTPRLLKNEQNVWKITRLLAPDGMVCVGWDGSTDRLQDKLREKLDGYDVNQLNYFDTYSNLKNMYTYLKRLSQSWSLMNMNAERSWVILRGLNNK